MKQIKSIKIIETLLFVFSICLIISFVCFFVFKHQADTYKQNIINYQKKRIEYENNAFVKQKKLIELDIKNQKFKSQWIESQIKMKSSWDFERRKLKTEKDASDEKINQHQSKLLNIDQFVPKPPKLPKKPITDPKTALHSALVFCSLLSVVFGFLLIKINYKSSPELTIIGIVLAGIIIGLIYYLILTKRI